MNHSSVAPRRDGWCGYAFRGLKPPATIRSRSARRTLGPWDVGFVDCLVRDLPCSRFALFAICRRAAFDGSPAFQGRD